MKLTMFMPPNNITRLITVTQISTKWSYVINGNLVRYFFSIYYDEKDSYL